MIMNFFEETLEDKEYKYKILVYPNITYQKDLEKDSYIVVIRNIIQNLSVVRDDIFWTLILPTRVQSLMLDNVEQIYYSYPSYPNSMRCHFDFEKLSKLIEWKTCDYDIVYSHLPEHTLQLKNLFYNTTNINPIFIGYTHWTEFPEITNYSETLMDVNLLGLYSMIFCGVNTIGQKNLILKNAKLHFNDAFVKKLDEIIQPQYLGWEIPDYNKTSTKNAIKTIAFNHRPHEYKNYPWFLKMMDKLYENRKDFRVWVPLAEIPDREYVYIGNNDSRKEYLTHLSKCWFGVCAKQKYAGWSVSATDGMSVGLPYLFADEPYYHELANTAGIFFKNETDFIDNCNLLLNISQNDYNSISDRCLTLFKKNTWNCNILQFNIMIDKAIEYFEVLNEETESYKKIVSFIKRNKCVSKKKILEHMNWGVRIKFTPYRNMLRANKNIKFTKYGYEYIK